MSTHWSPTLTDAIRKVLKRVEQDNGILDAYAAAMRIQQELPEENVALEDIIAALLRVRGAIQAIEFNPPAGYAGTVLEIIMPASRRRRKGAAANEKEEASVTG